MSDGKVLIYYLVKGRALPLQFRDGSQITFAPTGYVPEQFVAGLLSKSITIGGCCGKPSRTLHPFATQEQLDSGERIWIE